MISKGAFWGCSMKELTIEDGVKTLGVNAFRACVNIPEVNVPDSVTSIGVGCFYDCSGMVKAHIPDAITEIPDSLFSGCDNLSEFELSKNVKAAPHKDCAEDAPTDFSSDCIEISQAY